MRCMTINKTNRCRKSALARLEPALGLVDDINPALATHNAAIPVAVFERFDRAFNFHGSVPAKNPVSGLPPKSGGH